MRTKPPRVPAWPRRVFSHWAVSHLAHEGPRPTSAWTGSDRSFPLVLPGSGQPGVSRFDLSPFRLTLREEAGLAFWQGVSAAQGLAAKEV